MSLAAYIVLILAVFGGGLFVGWVLRGAHRGGGGFVTMPTETAEPVDMVSEMGGLPPRPGMNGVPLVADAYGIAQVRGLYCIEPQCRLEHPDPDIVLIGVGIAGSAYQCRHCLTTW